MYMLIALLTAITISVAIIPLMIQLAPRLRMVDLPDPRKVHNTPIPRVGGIGIALGSLVAMLVTVPMEPWVAYFFAGALVLVVFGAWDDSHELGHYVKFIGQGLAVIPLVWFGDLWVANVPFLADPLPAFVGKPFTVIAIIGVINAINHSDGLDGLAGGEAVLSLGCLAYLAHLVGDTPLVLMAFAVLGGLFGFLRFNTHPARVFMGDAGSQFLGFALAVMVVALTQKVNTSLSMALPALVIGLPIIDILAVFYLRMSAGLNWFRATRNHVHHRLLDLGFDHYQAVIIIYSIQSFFVACAILARHESDWLVTALYAVPCALLFATLTLCERAGVRVPARRSGVSRLVEQLREGGPLASVLVGAIVLTVPAYLLSGAFAIDPVPRDVAIALLVVGIVLGLALAAPTNAGAVVMSRIALYGTISWWVWSVEAGAMSRHPDLAIFTTIFFGITAALIAVLWKFARPAEFAPTTLDFLIAVVVAALAFMSGDLRGNPQVALVMVKVVLLLYAGELIYSRASKSLVRAVHVVAIFAVGLLLLRAQF
jgi:UDP-GlcNAc:undecaprenyl-phosphate GlcNAc-1-phosphate transferase